MKNAFELPADPDPLTRHPKAAAPGRSIKLHDRHCFGCGELAPVGLHLDVLAGEGITTTAQLTVAPWMAGGPGMMHGGLLSTAFDEVMSQTPLLAGVPVVTGNLEVDFLKPVPVGEVLHLECEVLARKRRKLFTRAIAHLGDREQPVAAAEAIFIQINIKEHWAEYRDVGAESRP